MTFWTTNDNYGGVLQSFALQQVLKSRGHDPFIIRYLPDSLYVKIKYYIKKLLGKQTVNKHPESLDKRKFNEFKDRYINSTDTVYHSFKTLRDSPPEAATYICGSDQVWNYKACDSFGYPWFLKFAPEGSKKIAFAASFGAVLPNKRFLQYIAPLLSDFDHIGVREIVGQEICAKVGRSDAEVVCDPTLLMDKEDYLSLLPAHPEEAVQPYSYNYLVGWDASIPYQKIKKYSDDRGLKLRFVASQGMGGVFQDKEAPTIPQWLDAFSKADFVFTNSFHGTIFAILMERPFVVFELSRSFSRMNSRINTLLSMLGLEHRVYRPAGPDFNLLADNPIDWFKVKEKIKGCRRDAEEFLTKCGL